MYRQNQECANWVSRRQQIQNQKAAQANQLTRSQLIIGRWIRDVEISHAEAEATAKEITQQVEARVPGLSADPFAIGGPDGTTMVLISHPRIRRRELVDKFRDALAAEGDIDGEGHGERITAALQVGAKGVWPNAPRARACRTLTMSEPERPDVAPTPIAKCEKN